MENSHYEPICVQLIENKYKYEEFSVLPCHELVIRPLLEISTYAYVYQGRKEDFFLYGKRQVPIKLEKENILISERGKFRFDKTKECIKGHEFLWNAAAWKRGSIVLIIEQNKVNFSELFKNTYNPNLSATPNAGNTLSAIKKCKEEMNKGNIGICFSATNGVEWIQIYINEENKAMLLKIAEELCKKVDTRKQALDELERMGI